MLSEDRLSSLFRAVRDVRAQHAAPLPTVTLPAVILSPDAFHRDEGSLFFLFPLVGRAVLMFWIVRKHK